MYIYIYSNAKIVRETLIIWYRRWKMNMGGSYHIAVLVAELRQWWHHSLTSGQVKAWSRASLLVFVCVQGDIPRGESGLDQMITWVYAAHGTSLVCGEGSGCCRVDPVCMLVDAYERWTGCSKMEPVEPDDAGKARKDGIRGWESQWEKKALQVERGPPFGLAIHCGKWRGASPE